MESRFFVTIKWLPSGYTGSVAWLALPCQEDDMESQFDTNKMAALWFPRMSRIGILTTNLVWCIEDDHI
jgi:hypothetical protein